MCTYALGHPVVSAERSVVSAGTSCRFRRNVLSFPLERPVVGGREETPGRLKGSLRSNTCVDVARIAETVNGGGHKRASGFAAEGNLDELLATLRERIIEALRACEWKDGSA